MKTGRNEPCHCGSGRKFKNCCERGGSRERRRWSFLWALLPILIGVGAVGALYQQSKQERIPPPERVWSEEHGHYHNVNPNASKPPGPPPPGKVWSAEHGHWHDADQEPSEEPLQDSPEGGVSE
jgi:hypothetical protein